MSSQDPSQRDFDLIVIGSGPAGVHAAVQAAKINKRVCIVEKDPQHIGGSWLHTGTLPSKTLREGLDAIHGVGIHAGKEWVQRILNDSQTAKLFGRAYEVSSLEERLLREFISNNRIRLFQGLASIEDHSQVRLISNKSESSLISANYIFIATGSKPERPIHIPFDGWRIVDSDDIFQLHQLPPSLVIYGAGVVGCEYACIFAAMGLDVTLLATRQQILHYCDQELVQELQKFMQSIGVKFRFGAKMVQLMTEGPKVKIHLGDEEIKTDLLFWAGRRTPNTDHLNLDKLGIQRNEQGCVVVNENFQTSIPNIYAVGDAIGYPSLASSAFQQGRFAACHAFGMNLGSFPKDFPIGIYTIPECSMVGKTENELKLEGREYEVGRAYYSEIARSTIGGQTRGLIKLLICKKTHKILGIHIVGEDACNLIHIGLAFMTKGGHAQDLINMVFNYPTLAEGYRIAAFNGLNKIFPDGFIKGPPMERRSNAYSSINKQK